MSDKVALIITTIFPMNTVLRTYAKECKELNIDFIMIGDVGSPPNFQLDDCDYWSIERQKTLKFRLANILPTGHYSRKNIGYLLAKERGTTIIIETDDDNLPKAGFWGERSPFQTGHLIEKTGWVNVYRYFTKAHIWPRGFPLQYVQESITPLSAHEIKEIYCPIQQGLADVNPDVDALYRLILPLPQSFTESGKIILGNNAWCPFNSQNTTWFKDTFPLLYLPSYCSFRMTDIWRSFVAERICWENDWRVLFHSPTVWQERNQHNLMKDFADEIPGYLNNAVICDALESLHLKCGIEHIPENMLKCYQSLVAQNVIDKKELLLLNAWLKDVQ